MRINDLHRSSEAIARKREVRKLATHAVLGDASVTTPGKRTQWGEEGAGGYAEAAGRLFWQGPVEFEGPFSNIGPFTNTGPLTNTGTFTNWGELEQNGASKLNGPVDIVGVAKLLSNLLVRAPGSITVQGVVDMLLENGIISYSNGATIQGTAGGVLVDSGSAQMQVATLVASLIAGASFVRVESTGNTVGGTTVFEDDVVMAGELDAVGIPSIPIAGAVSGALVRLPGGTRVYAAI